MADEIPAIFLNSDGGYSALSWNGFNVLGNRKSIDEVKSAAHAKDIVPQLRGRIKADGDRIAELEHENRKARDWAALVCQAVEDIGIANGAVTGLGTALEAARNARDFYAR